MVEIDRSQLLRALDRRHDELVRQLDELNERIEQALSHNGVGQQDEGRLKVHATCAPSGRSTGK